MLKKLVKYGNSTALVLDKAILELLNIGEGAVVKIKTDGTSLIITPHLGDEKLEFVGTPLSDKIIGQILSEYEIEPKDKPVLMAEYKSLWADRNVLIQKNMPAYQEYARQRVALAKTYENASSSSEFHQKCEELENALIPEIKMASDQLLNFGQVHGLKSKKIQLSKETMQEMEQAFTDLFQKYQHVQLKTGLMMEHPGYLHEMQLLKEQYGEDDVAMEKSGHREAYDAIRYKYVPEAREMDREMGEIKKRFGASTK